MINNLTIISYLFILFGIYAVIKPSGISIENLKKSYNVSDLIRGWGIYCITIGLLLYYPKEYVKYILITCFIASILWHISIIQKSGNTLHHKQSIIINSLLLIFTININYINHLA